MDFLEDRPIPITTYSFTITEEDRIVPGILFFAIINNVDNLTIKKHEEIKWINEKELDEISEDEAVPDFHDRAKRAFQIYNYKRVEVTN